jgi:hypothetical protein
MVLRDNTPSLLYTAFCFEDNDHATKDSTAGENMMLKQSFITMSSNESSSEDEGLTKLQKERQIRNIICKSFLLGSSTGFALQAMACAASYTLFKMFGKDSTTPVGLGARF